MTGEVKKGWGYYEVCFFRFREPTLAYAADRLLRVGAGRDRRGMAHLVSSE